MVCSAILPIFSACPAPRTRVEEEGAEAGVDHEGGCIFLRYSDARNQLRTIVLNDEAGSQTHLLLDEGDLGTRLR